MKRFILCLLMVVSCVPFYGQLSIVQADEETVTASSTLVTNETSNEVENLCELTIHHLNQDGQPIAEDTIVYLPLGSFYDVFSYAIKDPTLELVKYPSETIKANRVTKKNQEESFVYGKKQFCLNIIYRYLDDDNLVQEKVLRNKWRYYDEVNSLPVPPKKGYELAIAPQLDVFKEVANKKLPHYTVEFVFQKIKPKVDKSEEKEKAKETEDKAIQTEETTKEAYTQTEPLEIEQQLVQEQTKDKPKIPIDKKVVEEKQQVKEENIGVHEVRLPKTGSKITYEFFQMLGMLLLVAGSLLVSCIKEKVKDLSDINEE